MTGRSGTRASRSEIARGKQPIRIEGSGQSSRTLAQDDIERQLGERDYDDELQSEDEVELLPTDPPKHPKRVADPIPPADTVTPVIVGEIPNLITTEEL